MMNKEAQEIVDWFDHLLLVDKYDLTNQELQYLKELKQMLIDQETKNEVQEL